MATDLTPGMSLPEWTRPAGFETWNRFAAVNDEFVPIHMDDEAGRDAGMSAAFGQGNLLFASLHAALRVWSESGILVRISASFRKPSTKGSITVGGTVTSVDADPDGGTLATLDLWVKDAAGAVLAPATAVVRF